MIAKASSTPNLLLDIKPGYRPQASDTSIDTDAFEFWLLQQKSNGDRLQMSAILTQGARQLCLAGLRRTYASFACNLTGCWRSLMVFQKVGNAFL